MEGDYIDEDTTRIKIPPGEKRKTITIIDNVDINEPLYNSVEITEPIEDLLKTGIVNLNKPMGPTSHQVSSWVKNIFNIKKVGHGGTLDPRVTGVLPLAFGRTARLLNVLTYTSKYYVGIMRLHHDVQMKRIKQVASDFKGQIYQVPPIRSAVKRRLRVRTIYSLEILEQNKRDVLFNVVCEAGTYIRSLVHDLGLILGKGAHMQELRRIRTGPFHEKDSVTLHDLKDAVVYLEKDNNDTLIRKCVKPMEFIFQSLPKVVILDSAVDAICHGADLGVPGIIQFDEFRNSGEPVAIITRKGEGVAVGEVNMLSDQIKEKMSGIAVMTKQVMMRPGTYSKGWKSKVRVK